MNSLWSRYKLERMGVHTIERPGGFICYKVNGVECFIDEIYVDEFKRKEGIASSLCDEVAAIARNLECKYLSCSVYIDTLCAEDSLKAIMAYGFKLQSAHNNVILLVKELEPKQGGS